MQSAMQEKEMINFGGGHDSGFGGAIGMILLVVIVLWLLFKDGHGNGGNHVGGNYPPHCGGDYVPDMPDYMVDRDVINQGCLTRANESAEGEKTRALIVHENERASDKEYYTSLITNQGLLQAKDNENAQLKAMIYGNDKYNCLEKELWTIGCEVSKLPHAQPEYAASVTPITRPVGNYGYHGHHDNCCNQYA